MSFLPVIKQNIELTVTPQVNVPAGSQLVIIISQLVIIVYFSIFEKKVQCKSEKVLLLILYGMSFLTLPDKE